LGSWLSLPHGRLIVSTGWHVGQWHPPHEGDQFELELLGEGRAWYEPWGGMSPRGLTEASKLFSLGAPPARGLRADETPAQEMITEELLDPEQLLFSFTKEREVTYGE